MDPDSWVTVAFVWGLVAGILAGHTPRPPRHEWLLRIRVRAWFRYLTLGFTGICLLWTLALTVGDRLFSTPELASGEQEITFALAALGLTVGMLYAVLRIDLVATSDGVHWGTAFVPWRDITEVDATPYAVDIHLQRRYWWLKTFQFPGWLFTVSKQTAIELRALCDRFTSPIVSSEGAA